MQLQSKMPLSGCALSQGVIMCAPTRRAYARCRAGEVRVRVWNHPPMAGWFRDIPLLRGIINAAGSMQAACMVSVRSAAGAMLAAACLLWLPFVGAVAVSLRWRWHPLALMLLEGGLRWLMLLAAAVGFARLPRMRTVLQHHGAEHKAIACWEQGKSLTLENVRAASRLHLRCSVNCLPVGVAFAMLLSPPFAGGVPAAALQRLLAGVLLPGMAFEVMRYMQNPQCAAARVFSRPGLWLQRFFTAEPDDMQIEVAIASIKAVLPEGVPTA